MSVFSWLGDTLKKFIDGFSKFIDKLFNKIPDEIREKIGIVIDVVNSVKSAVDSPIADVITGLIPSTIDDVAKNWLRANLPAILEKLHVVQDGIIKLSDEAEIRAAQLRSVSSVLTEKLTGMDTDQAAITTQVVYKASK